MVNSQPLYYIPVYRQNRNETYPVPVLFNLDLDAFAL